ncbi:MAG: HAMP domain-containing histidine kinase [Myxococcales bacterium]|nr:HAMP domain-containing histidine kinase [Myxococcales bacterium]
MRTTPLLRRPSGIRGLLALGLAGLLAAAGTIASVVVTRLVGGEAESRVVAQIERRALAMAEVAEAVCRDMMLCAPQLARVLRPDATVGPDAAVLLDGELKPLAGEAEPGRPDPRVGDVLQGVPWTSTRVVRPAEHPRGAGVDQRVAVSVRLGDGRRGVLALAFSLDGLHRAVSARQWAVLLFILADLLAILLFGTYLGGRWVVAPIEALTRAAEQAAEGAAMPLQAGPREVERLSEAFAALVERLQARNRELAAAVAELSAARDELIKTERLATVGRLAAGLAHEIGNPLAAVLGYVEYLRGGDTPAELQRTLLGRMDKELGRIRDTLRDLLDFSRPSPATPGVVDLRETLASAQALLGYQRSFKDVAVVVEGEAPPVRADAGRVRQVFVNLLLNAADAMGGAGQVTVALAADAEGARVVVRDEGPGVPADDAAHLFEPFWTTKPVGQGTGLGLAICQRIVEEAGGTIRLLPGPGGAAFEVRLPRSGDDEGHQGVGQAPDEVVAEEEGLQGAEGEEGPEGDDGV